MAYGKIKADTLVYDNSGSDAEVTIASLGNKAPLASPTFTGTVTIPTPSSGDNTTKAASTAFVVAGFTAKPASAGTVAASEVVQVDANKDITGFRNVTLSGNLTVNGTTTTINSTTLTVDDKNIELGTVDTPSDTTADGGGITLKGASDKTITWTNATDTWDFNQNIKITSGYLQVYGTEAGAAEVYLYADEGDDNADKWRIKSDTSGNFKVSNYSTGSWVDGITLNGSNNATFAGDVIISDWTFTQTSNAYLTFKSGNAADAGLIVRTSDGSQRGVFYANSTNEAGILNSSGSWSLKADNSGNCTATGTVSDSKGNLRSILHNQQTSAYTAVAADAGKCIYTNSGVTINNSVFGAGDALTIVNYGGTDITITQGSGVTINNSADASTGNRTLASKGMCTIWFRTAAEGWVSGAGLS